MPDCPNQSGDVPPDAGDCVDMSLVVDLINYINTGVDQVNQVLDAAGEGPHIADLPFPAPGTCSSLALWQSFWDKMAELVATGRVWKAMYYPSSSTAWPPPYTSDLVDDYDRCDGWWGDISEIETCLSTDGEPNPDNWVCEKLLDIEACRRVCECIVDQKCHPACDCPECEEQQSCLCSTCEKCFTVYADLYDATTGLTYHAYAVIDAIAPGCICSPLDVINMTSVRNGLGNVVPGVSIDISYMMTGVALYTKVDIDTGAVQAFSTWHEVKYEPDAGNTGCDALEIPPAPGLTNCVTQLKKTMPIASATAPKGSVTVWFYMERVSCPQRYVVAYGNTLDVNLPGGPTVSLTGGLGSPWTWSGSVSWLSGTVTSMEISWDNLPEQYKLEIAGTGGVDWIGHTDITCGAPADSYGKTSGTAAPETILVDEV